MLVPQVAPATVIETDEGPDVLPTVIGKPLNTQPLASCTTTGYVPGAKPLYEVVVENGLPFTEYRYGAVPPVVAPNVIVPVDPLQDEGVLVLACPVGPFATATVVVPARLVQPPTVTVTLYVPAIAAVADASDGSSVAAVYDEGPVQLYVAPETVFAVKLIAEPEQTGVLLPAVGVAGSAFTTTVAVPAKLVQPPAVTVTLYVPDMATVAEGRVGFCVALVKDDGPVQAYVAPDTVGVVNEMVCPAQSGELLVIVGVAGSAFTTTVAVPARLVHPPTVTVTLYVPAIAAVAEGRVGFCVALVKDDGPVQAYVALVTAGVFREMV